MLYIHSFYDQLRSLMIVLLLEYKSSRSYGTTRTIVSLCYENFIKFLTLTPVRNFWQCYLSWLGHWISQHMLQKKRYIFNQIKYDRKITISYLKITKKSFHSKSGDSNPSDTEWYCQNWLLQLKINLIKNLLSFDKNQNTIFLWFSLWFFMIFHDHKTCQKADTKRCDVRSPFFG